MPLARAACPSIENLTTGISLDRFHAVLATLLAAAARGEGCVNAHSINLSTSEMASMRTLRDLVAFDGDLVLLPRYAHQLRSMRDFFERRSREVVQRSDDAKVSTYLDSLLPQETVTDPESGRLVFSSLHQRLAIAALVDARTGILTGGPGTGKTTTAAALLALKQRLTPTLTAERVLVTAPTGKAACRIAEALSRSTLHLRGLSEGERQFLRTIRCVTLHRALEWGPSPPEKGGPFRRNEFRPIDADVVLVDEASMVDLSLMHALINALPTNATLLLLGDSDQLRSVDVGGILAELVHRSAAAGDLGREQSTLLAKRIRVPVADVDTAFREGMQRSDTPSSRPDLSPISGLAFGLKYSRRAMNAPWVLQLADLTRPGSVSTVEEIEVLLGSEAVKETPNLRWMTTSSSRVCLRHCEFHWRAWAGRAASWTTMLADKSALVSPQEANRALEALGEFQLLCSTNEQVRLANEMGRRSLIAQGRHLGDAMPHGCPLLVTSNNRALNLSNGDVGIALAPEADQPAIVALFPGAENEPRLIPIAQLPSHQPAFGITIHKSQGSEWKHIVIQLPDHGDAQILSRNLLYTAVTRSSGKIDLFGQRATLSSVLGT